MKKPIRFSLIYRDMWQSSGKYVPRVDQLKKIAPLIIDMNCFSRIETNGGAFEQVNLLFGENPNKAVREWTKPFNEAGIQTHMLERALNGIRMFPVPKDVRKLMYQVKKDQGTNIARSFCGLNDHRNLELSIKYAKDAGMISQAALSITHSPVHTVKYYMDIVDHAIAYGADEICLKDMAGIGRPVTLGKLVKAIKKKHPDTIVQYHGHSGPGFSVASMLEVARAGADYVDVAMEPLSWGMVHPDVITIQAMLKDAGFEVPEINMKAYMEARALTQSFIDDFLGYFIDPKNRYTSSLLIRSGLPGGMMGSLMADLKGMHAAINYALKEHKQHTLNEDELLVRMFDEVSYIWPKLGYPPLVTPFSQYVKNVALLNILQLAKGNKRYSLMDENTWSMILGKAGKLPGPLAPEIMALAEKEGKEFYTGNPQDAFPDVLDQYRREMDEKGWERGEKDEELFEFAMHETQYRDYKSGDAKKHFEQELEKKKAMLNNPSPSTGEKQAGNIAANNKADISPEMAMAAFLVWSLRRPAADNDKSSVWHTIGYWRKLMKFEVLYEDKPYAFFITKVSADVFLATVGKHEFRINIESIKGNTLNIIMDDEALGFLFKPAKSAFVEVVSGDRSFLIKRMGDRDAGIEKVKASEQSSSSVELIKSPLPGRVFRINVKEGDEVKKGDVVIVIDAMKMENNLTTDHAGIVRKIYVKKGEMVEGGAPLVEIA